MEKIKQHQIITKRPDGSIRVTSVTSEETKTQQQFKDQCDINHIMKKYKATGEITHVNTKQGKYMDLLDVPSYEQSLKIVKDAKDSFENMPSDIRKRFGNDPLEMIKFLQDPNNNDDAIKLGLKQKQIQPEPTTNQILNETLNEIKKQNSKSKIVQAQE